MILFDNFIFRGLSRFLDMFFLSVLWLICCIPIVTIGAATTALYEMAYKNIRHERGYAIRGFFSSFKSNFKQSTILGLLFTVIFGCLGFDCYIMYIYKLEGNPAAKYTIGFWILILIVLLWSFYVFPYVARFQNTTKEVLKNTFFIMVGNLGSTLLLLLIFVIQCLGIYMYTPAIIVIPILYNYFKSLILEKVFKRYLTKEQIALEEEKNGVYSKKKK